MPEDILGLDDPKTFVEYRGIRGGEKGEKAPIKTLPRVRLPVRDSEKKFPIDTDLMISIARSLRVEDPVRMWASKVDAIPVYVLSDQILGDDGIIFLERALYAARGRLCGSPALDPKAAQRVDIGAYARNKTIKELPQIRDADCNDQCPMWGSPEKPTDCKFRAIVSLQLQQDPKFPSPSRHRTTSKNSIRSMVTSLKAISAVTGGVLAGIPLLFRQAKIDVKDRDKKTRRIPVMVFDFAGTQQQLREAAIHELASRRALMDAHDGEFENKAVSYRPSLTSLDEGMDADIEVEDRADDESTAGVPEPVDENQELASEAALLFRKMSYTPASKRAMESKHAGNLRSLVDELRAEAPSDFNPAPGAPGDEAEDDHPQSPPVSGADDLPDDLFE